MSGVVCTICFEEYKIGEDIICTNCGHISHTECYNTWRARSARSTCPTCNTPNAQTHKVFLNIEDRSQVAAKKLQDVKTELDKEKRGKSILEAQLANVQRELNQRHEELKKLSSLRLQSAKNEQELTTQLDQSVRDRSSLEATVTELQGQLDRSQEEMVQLRSLLDAERQSLQQYIEDNGELQKKLIEIESTQEVAQLQLQDTMSQNRDLQRQAEMNADIMSMKTLHASKESSAPNKETANKMEFLESQVQALIEHLETEIGNSTKLSLENKKLQQLLLHKPRLTEQPKPEKELLRPTVATQTPKTYPTPHGDNLRKVMDELAIRCVDNKKDGDVVLQTETGVKSAQQPVKASDHNPTSVQAGSITMPPGKVASPDTVIIKSLSKDLLKQGNLKEVPIELTTKVGFPFKSDDIEFLYICPRGEPDLLSLVVKFKYPKLASIFLNMRHQFAQLSDTKHLVIEEFMLAAPKTTSRQSEA